MFLGSVSYFINKRRVVLTKINEFIIFGVIHHIHPFFENLDMELLSYDGRIVISIFHLPIAPSWSNSLEEFLFHYSLIFHVVWWELV